MIDSPAWLKPDDLPTHFTAGAILMKGRGVLFERRPADARVYPDCWDLPGGHVEPGESPDAALVRECAEELDISVRRFRLAAVQEDREQATGRFYRHFVYLVDGYEGEPAAREGQTLEWWPVAELEGLADVNPLAVAAVASCIDRRWLP